jgi:anti-anti-sigma factor
MNISIEDLQGATVLRFAGNLDTSTAPEAELSFNRLIEGGRTKLLVDFGPLDYISSAGLRVLLVAAKRLGAGGGKLRLCGLNDFVRQVFDTSGFSTILQVFEREEDALRGF